MNYEDMQKIDELVEALEDWKREKLSDEGLAKKCLDVYKILEKEKENTQASK